MSYVGLFLRVADYVRAIGLEPEFERNPPITKQRMEELRKRASIPLPESLLALYQEIGDGMRFHWSSGEEEGPFANIEFEPLEDLMSEHESARSYSVEWDDSYQYPFVDDSILAKQTALKMRNWFAFHAEGNGDMFCLDTADPSCPVVFDQHDWMDGGTGDNGAVMAASLRQFMEEWSQVCFQMPTSLWWGSVLRDGRVDWNSDEFPQPLRLPRG